MFWRCRTWPAEGCEGETRNFSRGSREIERVVLLNTAHLAQCQIQRGTLISENLKRLDEDTNPTRGVPDKEDHAESSSVCNSVLCIIYGPH